MASETLKIKVIHGDTFRVECIVRDYDKSLMDPDSHAIKLLKPDGTQQGTTYTNPTRKALGEYYQHIPIPADGVAGDWMVEWTITESGENTTERIRVPVVL